MTEHVRIFIARFFHSASQPQEARVPGIDADYLHSTDDS